MVIATEYVVVLDFDKPKLILTESATVTSAPLLTDQEAVFELLQVYELALAHDPVRYLTKTRDKFAEPVSIAFSSIRKSLPAYHVYDQSVEPIAMVRNTGEIPSSSVLTNVRYSSSGLFLIQLQMLEQLC